MKFKEFKDSEIEDILFGIEKGIIKYDKARLAISTKITPDKSYLKEYRIIKVSKHFGKYILLLKTKIDNINEKLVLKTKEDYQKIKGLALDDFHMVSLYHKHLMIFTLFALFTFILGLLIYANSEVYNIVIGLYISLIFIHVYTGIKWYQKGQYHIMYYKELSFIFIHFSFLTFMGFIFGRLFI